MPSEETRAPAKPNILFIAIDDLRPELGCFGAEKVKSPNIDKLASEGTVFTRAYCQMSWCSPSRTSLLTGLYPANTGVVDLKTHFRNVIPEVKTLPQHFKENGYTTLGFGKIFHNDTALQDSLSWSRKAWLPPGNPIQAYALEENLKVARANDAHKATATEKADVPDNAYPDGQTTDRALAALQELSNSGEPFFLGVGYYKPHLPFTAPAKYWDMYQKEDLALSNIRQLPENAPSYIFRDWSEPGSYYDTPDNEPFSDSLSLHLLHGYYACVSFIDAQVGRLVNELETLGMAQNTIIVLWGDHGFKLGEYSRWSKHSTMDIDTRVPLVVAVPWAGVKSTKVEGIVELVDLYPTLCELAGLSQPEQKHDGTSFARFTHSPNDVGKNYAYSTIIHDGMQGHSLKTSHYRFTTWFHAENPKKMEIAELYDHVHDPDETKNLYNDAAFQEVVADLQEKLNSLRAEFKDEKQYPD